MVWMRMISSCPMSMKATVLSWCRNRFLRDGLRSLSCQIGHDQGTVTNPELDDTLAMQMVISQLRLVNLINFTQKME